MRRFALLLVASAFMGCGAVAHADVIFDFSGTCTSGSHCLAPTYTGTLDLVSTFVPGSVINQSDVVYFELQTPGWFFGYPTPVVGTNVCGLPASGACSGQTVGLKNLSDPSNFYSFADGSWRMDEFGAFFSVQGTNATWTEVPQAPLPSAWLLLATALLGLFGLPRTDTVTQH
jgi:hypothetical protein